MIIKLLKNTINEFIELANIFKIIYDELLSKFPPEQGYQEPQWLNEYTISIRNNITDEIYYVTIDDDLTISNIEKE